MDSLIDGTQEKKLLRPLIRIPLRDRKALCSQFAYDNKWLAIGSDVGAIDIYRVSDGGLAYSMNWRSHSRWPCSSLCFRPQSPSYTSQNVILSSDVGGQVHHWHATSGKHLSTLKEEGNQIYSVNIQPAAVKFATAGSDFKVRIYDETTRKLIHYLFEGNGQTSAGHTNRVFAVKWHPTDVNIVLSGGWDSTVQVVRKSLLDVLELFSWLKQQIWDLRVGISVRSIFGAKICGESIDISSAGNTVLTGSWRPNDQLQEWDYGSGGLVRNLKWMSNNACQLYTARYGKGVSEKLIAAGGSRSNSACLFHAETGQPLAAFLGMKNTVSSVSFSESGALFVVTTGDYVYIVDIIELAHSLDDLYGAPAELYL